MAGRFILGFLILCVVAFVLYAWWPAIEAAVSK